MKYDIDRKILHKQPCATRAGDDSVNRSAGTMIPAPLIFALVFCIFFAEASSRNGPRQHANIARLRASFGLENPQVDAEEDHGKEKERSRCQPTFINMDDHPDLWQVMSDRMNSLFVAEERDRIAAEIKETSHWQALIDSYLSSTPEQRLSFVQDFALEGAEKTLMESPDNLTFYINLLQLGNRIVYPTGHFVADLCGSEGHLYTEVIKSAVTLGQLDGLGLPEAYERLLYKLAMIPVGDQRALGRVLAINGRSNVLLSLWLQQIKNLGHK